jgi:hypothetical protein
MRKRFLTEQDKIFFFQALTIFACAVIAALIVVCVMVGKSEGHEDSWWKHAPATEEGSTGYKITGDKSCGMGVHMWKIGPNKWIPVIWVDNQLHVGAVRPEPDCQLTEYEPE